jgi:hypothetical protein
MAAHPQQALRDWFQACLTICLVGGGTTTAVRGQDSVWIERARQVSVVSLDSSLPVMPLEQWLATLRPLLPSTLHWEVNDCGEGGDGREAPTCVEAILDLAPDTTAHASLIMAGLDGAPGQPAVWMLYGMVRNSVVEFKQLREWAAFVRSRSR